MAAARPLRLAPEWDDRFTRMVGVSAVGHLLALVAVLAILEHAGPRPLPMVAYTVEITDPSQLGGRLLPGAPARDLGGARTAPAPAPPEPAPAVEATPEPRPEPPAAPKPEPPAPPVSEPAAKAVVAPKPEPRPLPPPAAPKAETKPPEPPKAPVRKAEPSLPEPPRAEPRTPEPAKPTPAEPAAKPTGAAAQPKEAAPAAKAAPPGGAQAATADDAYAAAAERWRARPGGGLGGAETGSGPVGTGAQGAGGGGELVGLEYLAYNAQIRNAIRARWTGVTRRPGLVAYVYFRLAPDGTVSDVRLHQGSGDAAYDASVVRAVQHSNPLPPPPVRYRDQFEEVIVDLHSEEQGGSPAP